ncbi:MAG: plasmid mobilization relaxosome protein MobC [Xanthobacteraceae bacterium]
MICCISARMRSGLRPVDYGRAKLFNQKRITEAVERRAVCPDPLIFVQLSRLGNNLNQIARKLDALSISAEI